MCEDHLYWLLVHDRWMNDGNFERGPATFFKVVPAPVRPLIKIMIRRKVRQMVHCQGLGRLTDAERSELAARCLASISAILGDKPYLMGSEPCGADASVLSMVAGVTCPSFDTESRKHVERHPNLLSYRARLFGSYFPELATAQTASGGEAGCESAALSRC
jgi:glutathione S-transferase